MPKVNTYSLSNKFLNTFLSENRQNVRSLSYYLYLSKLIPRGFLKDSNVILLAKISGKNLQTIKRYIAIFKNLGWIEEKNGHLYFRSLYKKYKNERQFRKKYRQKFKISDNNLSTDYIQDLLYAYIMKHHKQQFDFMAKLGNEGVKKDVKKILKTRNKYNPQIRNKPDNYNCSYERIGKLFNCSKVNAFYIIHRLIKRNWIKKENRTRQIGKANSDKSVFLQGKFFIREGFVYMVENNAYCFNNRSLSRVLLS